MPELRHFSTAYKFPGLSTDFYSTRMPHDWRVDTVGDLELRMLGRPETWRPTSANAYAMQGVAGDLSWRVQFATNGFVQVYLSANGTVETGPYASSVAIPNNSPVNGVQILRPSASGDMTIKTTEDGGVSWQTLGAVVPTFAGPIHTSHADIIVGVGTTGFTGAFKGLISEFQMRSDVIGGLIRVHFDASHEWRYDTKSDVRGNEWVKHGVDGVWVVGRSSMASRPMAPDLSNLVGWSGDFAHADSSGGSAPAVGTVTCARIIVPEDRPVNSIHAYILSTGTGITASQNFFALHDLDGRRLGICAAKSSADLGTGTKTFDLVTPIANLRAGEYSIKMLLNGTTAPVFARGSNSAAVNMRGSASLGWRFFTEDTGQTAIPSTPGVAQARNDVSYLVGIS